MVSITSVSVKGPPAASIRSSRVLRRWSMIRAPSLTIARISASLPPKC